MPATNKKTPDIRVWHPEHFESLELHRGTAVLHPHPRHWHEELLVCAITGGAGYVDYRGAATFTPSGSLMLVAPGEVHANWACEQGCSYRSIYLPVSLLTQISSQISRLKTFPAFPIAVTNDGVALESFLAFHRSMEYPESRVKRESLLFELATCLMERGVMEGDVSRNEGNESVAVRLAQDYLQEHYDQSVSLDDLARLSNLSPFYLHRTFCRQTGIPPHAYQMQVRISRAKSFLRKNLPIAHVASATGFADQSHLTRHFKRLVGVTPAQFCRQGKNVQDPENRLG